LNTIISTNSIFSQIIFGYI